jgi:uncharacterized protein (TIGR00730 family)
MDSLCVFCGSKFGNDPKFEATAIEFGRLLTEHKIDLVYGGGNVGLMGVLANTVLENGGKVTGIMPEHLVVKELAHKGLTKFIEVKSMHERKATMAKLSDGFIALPGGFGTLEEICEVLTWSMLGLHKKPCGFLNVDGFFDDLLKFFDLANKYNFIASEHKALAIVSNSAEDILQQFRKFKHSAPERSYDRI